MSDIQMASVITITDPEGHGRLARVIVSTLQREGYHILLKNGKAEQQMTMPKRGIRKEVTVEIK